VRLLVARSHAAECNLSKSEACRNAVSHFMVRFRLVASYYRVAKQCQMVMPTR